MRKLLAILLTMVMMLSVFAGCSSSGDDTPDSTSGDGAVTDDGIDSGDVQEISKFGGSMSIGVLADPDSLNPSVSTDRVGAFLAEQQYPTLMRMDENAQKIPYIAESIETSEDGLTVTIKLIEGLKWTDGTPLTSKDVLFTYQYNYEHELASQAAAYEEVVSAETPDDTTLIFTLKRPFPTFITKVGFWIRIIPQHIWEGIDDPDSYANDQLPNVVFGPYQMTEAQRGQFYVLESVDEFFLSPEGKPYLDTLVYRVYPDINTMVLALRTGEIHVTAKEIPVSAAKELEGVDGITVVQNSSLGFTHLTYNMVNEFLSDVTLRQAIAIAVDRDNIINLALEGAGQIADTPITFSYPQIHNEDATIGDYNPDGATTMLTDAGYSDTDSDGILNAPNGKNVELALTYDGNDPYHQRAAQIIEANLEQIGIAVTQSPIDKGTMSDLLYNQKDFDFYIGNWGIIDPLNDSIYTCYHTDSYMNSMSRERSIIDDAIEGIRYATSIDDQVQYAYDYQVEWLKEMPNTVLYVQSFYFAYNDDYKDFTLYPSDLKGLTDPQSTCKVYISED